MKIEKNQIGFTLVELLVSMAIGLFLVTGVISVMLDSKENFLLEQELAYIQENARFAMDELAYDVRMAGYTGCSLEGELTNTVDNPAASNWKYSSLSLVGYEQGNSNVPSEFAADVKAGTDVIIVHRGEPNETVTVESHTPSNNKIVLTDGGNFEVGELLVIASANCGNMAIFQKTGPADPDSTEVLHANSGTTPGNCYHALSGPSGTNFPAYDCSSVPASGDGLSYPSGSTIMRYLSNAYYVKTSPATGLPTLFKQTLVASGGAASSQARELISGVEDLEIVYGVDNDATPDDTVDRYLSASSITAQVGASGNSYVAWDRVISARITLVLRSMREVFPQATSVDLGDGDTFNDRFMRQKISSTVRIRNRAEGV